MGAVSTPCRSSTALPSPSLPVPSSSPCCCCSSAGSRRQAQRRREARRRPSIRRLQTADEHPGPAPASQLIQATRDPPSVTAGRQMMGPSTPSAVARPLLLCVGTSARTRSSAQRTHMRRKRGRKASAARPPLGSAAAPGDQPLDDQLVEQLRAFVALEPNLTNVPLSDAERFAGEDTKNEGGRVSRRGARARASALEGWADERQRHPPALARKRATSFGARRFRPP